MAGRAKARRAGNDGVECLCRLDVPHVGGVLPERGEHGPQLGFLHGDVVSR